MFLFRSKKKKKNKLVDPSTPSSRLQGNTAQPPSTDMPFGWFYWKFGNLCGPCDDASIIELLAKGELKEHSAVSLMNIPIATLFEDLLQRMNSASRIKAHFKNSAVGTGTMNPAASMALNPTAPVAGTGTMNPAASMALNPTAPTGMNPTASTGIASLQLAIPQTLPLKEVKEEESPRLSQQSRSPQDSPKHENSFSQEHSNRRDSEGNFSNATSMDDEEAQLQESLSEGRQKKGSSSRRKSKSKHKKEPPSRRRNSADDSQSESESDDARRKPNKPTKSNRRSDSEGEDARDARRKPDKPTKKHRHHSDSESDDARRKPDKSTSMKHYARPHTLSPRPKEAEEKSRRDKHERGRRDKDKQSFALAPTLSVPKHRSEKGDKKDKKCKAEKDDSDKKSKKDRER